MSSVLIPFGIKDGELVHILDVANGHACGCTCPGCGEDLSAVNNPSNVRRPHFAHVGKGDCGYNPMTDLHRFAQLLIYEEKRIGTPKYRKPLPPLKAIDGSSFLGTPAQSPAGVFNADRALLEYSWQGFRSDVLLIQGKRQLHVEVLVTSDLSDNKRAHISESSEYVLELDLSQCDPYAIFDKAAFKKLVVDDVSNKSWLNFPIGKSLYSRQRRRQRKDLVVHNQKLKEDMDKQAAADRERKLLHDAELKKEHDRIKLERAKHIQAINYLNATRNGKWLSSFFDLRTPEQERSNIETQLSTVYRIVDTLRLHSALDWIFEVHPYTWQSSIIGLIYNVKIGTYITIDQIESYISSKFKVHSFLKDLYPHLNSKPDPVFRLAKNANKFGWFLHEHERKSIVKPDRVITSYLYHLSDIGLINISGREITPYFHNLKVGLDRLKERELQKNNPEPIIQNDDCIKTIEECNNALHEPRGLEQGAVQRRAQIMAAAEEMIANKHLCKGKLCLMCFIPCPASAIKCPYCKFTEFTPMVSITGDKGSLYYKYEKNIATEVIRSAKVKKESVLDLSSLADYL